MAEYEDPLSSLPTVAPPRYKKKEPGEDPFGGGVGVEGPLTAPTHPGVAPVDGAITETADDYFGNFPQDDAGSPTAIPFFNPIEHTTEEFVPDLYSDGMPWPGDPVNQTMNAMAPIPEGPLGDFGRERLHRMREIFPDTVPPTAAPVPGGDQGIPEDDIMPPGSGGDGGSGTPGDLDAYIRHLLENPTRYDDDLVQQGLAQIDSELADKRQGAMTGIEEMMAQRGLVGSSVEANTAAELMEDLERQRSGFAFDLHREQANTRMQDMQAAGQLAISHRANQLRERGMNLDDAYRQAALEFEQTKFFGDDAGGFPGTFAQDQYLAELDAYYKTLQMLAQTGMDSDDLKRWQQQNPRPQPVGGVPEGYEIPESEYESWIERVQRQAKEAAEARRQRQADSPNFWDDWFNQG